MDRMGFGACYGQVREQIGCVAAEGRILLNGKVIHVLPQGADFESFPRVKIAFAYLAWIEALPNVRRTVRAYDLEAKEVVTLLEKGEGESRNVECFFKDDTTLNPSRRPAGAMGDFDLLNGRLDPSLSHLQER